MKLIKIQGHHINPDKVIRVINYDKIFRNDEYHDRTRILFVSGDDIIVSGKPDDIARLLTGGKL